MVGFYFSKVPVFKIAGAGVDGGKMTTVPLVPEAVGEFHPPSLLKNPYFCRKMSNDMTKRKGLSTMKERRLCQKGPRKMKMTQWIPRGQSETSIPAPHGWTERINIGSSQNELDPAVLENLPAPSAIAVASVHKYWTSTWAKATDDADLIEMIKMTKMSTTWSHVLNCELYKVLVMKVDELRSTVTGIEDIDELRSENKILCSMLAIYDDAKEQAEFKIIKSKMIQMLSVSARKQAEWKLKVCEDMSYTKHKQLPIPKVRRRHMDHSL
ncbi:hypothetical protein Fot_19667 [Forsythia ovata]|uniref:Uncharacterized protein n=1 Tax=Forsythia ovata TaxID=205694 RepID=A0ABD1VLQ4_9LAMI